MLHKKNTNLEIIQQKIFLKDDLERQLKVWRFKDKKIVFTNGCFDLLHPGHIHILAQAKDLGDIIIIGVNSDDSVKRLNKGASRPIQDYHSRCLLLSSIQFVNAVIVFDEDTPAELIEMIQPDVLVKGGDYSNEKEIVGYEAVISKGGLVKIIPFLEGHSTSLIEKRIKS